MEKMKKTKTKKCKNWIFLKKWKNEKNMEKWKDEQKKKKNSSKAHRETTLRPPLRRRCAMEEPLTPIRNCGSYSNVEKELAKPAATAFLFLHRRTVKTMVVQEHWAGAQDGSKFSIKGRTRSGKLGRLLLTWKPDAALKKGDVTDTFSQIEAVKAEANTEVMERIKIGSIKLCIHSDLAKKNMMFSQEPCQAIIEMCNVELIELKKSRVQCPSCLHYVFGRTITCSCGKHIRSNQEVIQRIKKAFEVLKCLSFVHLIRLQAWTLQWQQHQHKAHDALRRATRKKDRTYNNVWDRWEKDLEYRKS